MDNELVQSDSTETVQKKMLFKPASWLTKIDFINQLVLLNNVLISVLGEKGGGKTSFCNLLRTYISPQIKCIPIALKHSWSKEAVINELATQLHFNPEENSDIAAIAAKINDSKAHILLLIDDAQLLPESFISDVLLIIKNQGNFGFFHVCLISDFSIVQSLNDLVPGVYDDLVHSIELGLLDKNETRTYALQRAMITRLIQKPLTDAQFNQFYQLTKGNMAEINRSLESFVFKSSIQKKSHSFNVINKMSVALSIAFILGFTGFYIPRAFYSDLFSLLGTTKVSLNQVIQKITPSNVIKKEKVLVSQIASWQDPSSQKVDLAISSPHKLNHQSESLTSDNPVAVTDSSISMKTAAVNTVKDHQVLQSARVLESKINKISGLIPRNALKAKITKSKIKTNVKLYTLQFAASHNKNDLVRLQQGNSLLANKAKLSNFHNEKGIWYVLILGEFESRAQAQQSIKKLPTSLAKLNPWIRSISTLTHPEHVT